MSDDGNEFSREFLSGLSIAMGVASGVSLICCIYVILLIYTKEKLFKRNLCKFIMILMANEAGTAIGTSLGMSTDGSFSCWLQAFLTSYFPYCQSLWLSLTAWMLYQIIFHSKPTNLLSLKSFAMCSGVPLILALLPLTTQAFGNEGDSSGWCFLKNRSDSPKLGLTMWTILSYIIIYLNIISYTVVMIVARKRLSRSKASLSGHAGCEETLRGIMDLLYQLIWYPIIIFFVILPESVYDIVGAMGGDSDSGDADLNNNAVFTYVSHVCPITSGVFMPLAFLLTNTDANAEVRAMLGLAPVAPDKVSLSNTNMKSNDRSSSESSGVVSMTVHLSTTSRTDTISSSTIDEV